MWKLTFLVAMMFSATSVRSAEIPFLNPFATPQELALQRSTPEAATHRLTFRRTTKNNDEADQVATVVIDVANDWALYSDGSRTTLHDYRLLSWFVIDTTRGTFSFGNKVGNAAFLVAEIVNRKLMQRLLDSAGTGDAVGDVCDSETELRSRLPEGDDFRGNVTIDRDKASITATCNGRTIGTIQLGEGGAVPAALWPTLVATLPLHPALSAEFGGMTSAPRQLQVFYEQVGGSVTETLTLEAAGPSAAPYPLTADLRNTSADRLAATTTPELALTAQAAVAGTADGGVPTSESWGRRLYAMAQEGNGSSAVLALLPTSAMFPELLQACSAENKTPACVLSANLIAFAEIEPAVGGALAIAKAQQSGDQVMAMAAMMTAQRSDIADDPVLGQTFALALLTFGGAFQEGAASAGLPSDPLPLMVRSIEAYPYNPWYWTDLADLYIAKWDYDTAMMLLAVAFSLDIPAASNPLLIAKAPKVGVIRQLHPSLFLPD